MKAAELGSQLAKVLAQKRAPRRKATTAGGDGGDFASRRRGREKTPKAPKPPSLKAEQRATRGPQLHRVKRLEWDAMKV